MKSEIQNDSIVNTDFKEDFYDLLYTYFIKYFSESGSIYFNETSVHDKIYDINRIHDDFRNSKIMLICNVIALVVATFSLLFSIHISNAQAANEKNIKQGIVNNDNITIIHSASQASEVTVEDIVLISSASDAN